MWNGHSKKSAPCILVVICGLLSINGGVKATYNNGVKTTVYTSEPQITTQTYTTHHQTHHYVPVSGEYEYTHNHNNLGSNGNDNDYQTTITHQSRGSAPQWTSPSPSSSNGSNANAHHTQQHEGNYYPQQQQQHYHHHQQQPQQYQQHQQQQQQQQHYYNNHNHQQQPQQYQQQQPIYERGHASQVVQQSGGQSQIAENDITNYYNGCPSGHTGQLPYAYDCRRFLNCWKGRGHIQSCSVGTVFNPETLECDRPDKVKCGAGSGSGAQAGVSHTAAYGQSSQSAQHDNRAGRYIDAATDSVDILCPTGAQGLEPHPSDCTKFINCANGNVHIQDCGPGTAFSIPTKVCDFKDKVDCSGRGGTAEVNVRQGKSQIICPSGASGLYPHPHDCTKFLQCANGVTHIQDCGPGTAFDSLHLVCDFKEKVNCGSGSSSKSGKSYGDHSTAGYGHNSNNVQCPPSASGLHAHPHDCTKFLQCANGVTHVQDCGPGTGFDSVHKVCDFKAKVHCASGSTWGVSKSGEAYGEHSTTREYGVTSERVECPHGVSGLYPHPHDCEKFMQCSNGQTYIQSCGPGTGFDSIRLVCDYKEKVQCGSGSIWGTTNVITTEHAHTQQTTSSSSGGHSDLPHNADLLCLNGITGLFPYPFDYTKFINCKNGNTAIQNCVQGTAFSISKGYCESMDQIEKSDHVMYIVSEVSYEYSQTLITCPPGTEGIHLYPFNAEKFVKCVHSQMEVVSCPPAQVFSVMRRSCLPIGQVLKYERVRLFSELQTPNSNRIIEDQYDVHTMVYCPRGLSGTYPHPFDSSRYITCGGGRMICESCASGKAFSLSRKECDMKEELAMGDRVPKAELNYGEEWPVTDMETTYGSVDGLTYLMCPPGVTGYFLHPFDCTKYIECSSGATNIDTCTSGTVYSISRKECIPRDKVEAFDRVEYMTTTQNEFSNEHVLHSDHDLGFSCGPGTFGIYPHPQDCHKFMRCANGRIAVENCPPGQVFSIAKSVCNNENEVSQHDRSSYGRGEAAGQYGQTHYAAGGATATATTATTATNNYNSGSGSYHTPNPDIGCPANANGRYPHPHDCTKFVMCSNGVAHVQSCGPGTAWSKVMEVCDFKDNVDCSQTGAVTVRKQPEISCPPGSEGLYKHPYDWHKYLSCANGQTYVMDCGPGTVFSVSRRICDLEANVVNADRCNNGVFSNDYDYSYTETYNNRDSKAYGTGTGQWSYTGTSRHQPPSHTNTHTRTHTQTTSQQGSGDRWTNMNVPRPQGSSYDQQATTWQHGPNTYPTTVTKPETTSVWSGTAINVDQQSPSHTVIYEEGSLQPDRNYNHHTYSAPLAPLPGTGQTSTSTIVYAQPIGSQEESEEVFSSKNPHPHAQYPYSSPHYNPNLNRQNFTRNIHHTYSGNTWTPISPNPYPQVPVTTHLMPPLQGPALEPGLAPTQPLDQLMPPFGTAPQNPHYRPPTAGSPQLPSTHGRPPTAGSPHQPSPHDRPPTAGSPHQPSPYDRPPTAGSPQLPSPYDRPPTSGSPHLPSPYGRPQLPSGPHIHRPITQLMPPTYPIDDGGQRPLSESDQTFTTIYVDNFPGQPWPYDPNQQEPVSSGSRKVVTVDESNLYGGLQPPFSDTQITSTQRPLLANPEQTGQLAPPTRSTTPIPSIHGYPKLSNATIQTFPNQPHYSPAYSEVAHSRNASWTGRKIPQQSAIKPTNAGPNRLEVSKTQSSRSEHHEDTTISETDPEQLPLKEALQLMLRPYFNRSGTVDDDMAARAESHIMSLVSPADREPEQTTTTHNPLHATSISIPSTTPHQVDVELILAGEQHSLVSTTSTQSGTQETSTYYDLQHTTVASERSTQSQSAHTHDHDSNWHKHHQHTPSSSKHQHSREYHEKHPHLPNPFAETPESLGIDVRSGGGGGGGGCPFNCGNGKCIAQHEVCNGVNNCGNRKDEQQCDHLGYQVRLTGGESSNKGRVEVKILGKWGYVCDDKFGLKDADVLCRELGFKMGAMEVRGSSYYPPTDVNTLYNMDEVECKGNETSLRECDFKGWGVNNCGPDEVVGVVCKVQKLKCPDNYWLCSKSEECIPTAFLCDLTPDCTDGSDESPIVCNAPIEYRLEGGRSKNEGRLEIFYRGEWGTVCDDDFGLKEAQVACNSMGFYGKPQVAKNIYGPGSGPIWLDQVSCVGNETKLEKCNHWTWGENNCQHTEDVGLKCTAGPKPTSNRPVVVSTSVREADLQQTQVEYEQSELDDLGKYQGLWQRSSKAANHQKQCGHFKSNLVDEYAHPEERVINGSIAMRGRHPWQATIRTRGRGGISSHWCGAVIISKKLILTAAHCLAGYPKGSYFVRVGDHYANIAEASEIDSNIENWYIHEKFREEKHMNNDIALILLKSPLRFNDYVQPICLPEKGSQLVANRKCTISGWGSIKSGTSTPSNILRAAEVPILGEDVCRQKNVYSNAMSDGMFCAGFLDENVDACDGDSGGPLVCSDDDGETLYGIISWGQHCGYANHPGVYVRVEKYIDWIYEKINLMIQQGKL